MGDKKSRFMECMENNLLVQVLIKMNRGGALLHS